MDTEAFLKAFMGLFAMMNPIGNTGIFISTVGDLPTRFKVKAAIKTSLAVLVILEISIFGGTEVLKVFDRVFSFSGQLVFENRADLVVRMMPVQLLPSTGVDRYGGDI